nr:MAG TPA: minor tail protein [Caudoviricetes sp.]
MASNKIDYDINFNVDMSSLELLKEALNNIQTMSSQYYIKINGGKVAEEQLKELKQTASQVEIAIDAAFNPKLNTMNFVQFNSILQASNLNIQKIEQQFNMAGDSGKRAFRSLTEQIFTANAELKKTKGFIANIGETLFNAAKWSVSYGIINNIINGIKSAWNYAISLDSALNDIRIVTGQSYEQMEKFAVSANKAAKNLGTSTKNYTKGALIYYQQGLSEKDVIARTNVTAKAANVTGQTVQEVSEQLTAVWNGYKVVADEAEVYVDKLAAVAASSASDLEELSTAMSRVASSANTMGINVDQLTAQIATIESVTRQDAASIGTALKTIYSRMGDLAIGAEDEFGVALGDVSGKMKQMGIDILDQEGNMRSMGVIIEEVAAKWNTWTSAQQQAAAVALAGKRQYNNLFALFENWDMYEANKAVSETSLGELQREQDIYMESTAAHIQQMRTAAEGLKEALFDNKSMNAFFDVLKFGLEQLTSLVNGLGGAGNILLGVFSSLGVIYSEKIGQGLGGILANLKSIDSISINQQARAEILAQYGGAQEKTIQKMVSLEEDRLKYANVLTEQDEKRYDLMIKQTNELATQKELVTSMINRAGTNIAGNAKNVLTEGLSSPIKNAKQQYSALNAEILATMSDEDRNTIQKNVSKERKALNIREDNFNILDLNKISYAGKKDATPTQKGSATKAINKIQQLAQQQLDTGLNKESEAYKNLNGALDSLNRTIDKNGKLTSANKDTREEALKVANLLKKTFTEEVVALDNVDQAISEGLPKYKAIADAEKTVADGKKALADQKTTEQQIANITSVVSAMAQFATVIMSLTNLMEVWSDENVSIGEKIKQTVMVILSLAPMVISVAKVLHTQLVGLAAKTNVEVTASLGWIGLILAAAAAVVSLIVYLAQLGSSQKTTLQKAQENYEEMKKTLEAMSSALKTAKENYASLGETIDKYKSARDNIDNLKAGTDEFKEAVYEANLQALELINTYDILSQYASYDRNGILKISDAGFDELLKQKQKEISQQQLGILYQNNSVADKKINFEAAQALNSKQIGVVYETKGHRDGVTYTTGTNVSNQTLSETDSQKILENYKNAIKEGKEINDATIFKGIDLSFGIENAVGVVTESTQAIIKSLQDTKNKSEKLIETIEKNNKAIIQNTLAINSQNYADVKNKDAYTNMVAANTKITRAIKSFYTGSDNIVVANWGGGVGGNYWLNSDDIATQLYKNNKITEEEKKKLSDALVEKGMSTVPELLASFYGVDKNDLSVQRNSKGGASVYYTKEGTTHKIDFSQVENIIQSQVATIFADTVLGPEFRDFINSYTTGEKGGQNSRGTQGKYADILNLTGGKTNAHLNNTTLADLDKMSWNNLPQEIKDKWEEFGFSSQEGLQKAYEAAIKNSKKAINEGFTEIHSLGADITGEFTEEEMKSLVNGYNQVFSQLGKDGVDQLNTLLNQFAPEKAAKIAGAISNIDLTSVTNISDFVTALEKAGVEIDLTDDRWQKWLNTLTKSQSILREVINNFKNIRTNLASIKKLTESLSVGDVISDEDYQQIIAYNAAAKEWFVQTADGYKLIKGSAESLASFLKTPYKNLEDIVEKYNQLETIGKAKANQSYNAAATGTDLQKEFAKFFGLDNNDDITSLVDENGKTKTTFSDKALKDINTALDSSTNAALLETAGVSKDEIIRILNKPVEDRTDEEKAILQNFLGITNDIITTTANGGYSRSAALKRWGIDVSANYGEVEAAYKNGKFGTKDSDEAKKIFDEIRSSYVADWAKEYSLSIDVINKLSQKYASDFDMLQNLEFLQNYEKIISKLQDTAQYLTGEALAENLKTQNEQLEKAQQVKQDIVNAQLEELKLPEDIGKTYEEILAYYQENAGKLTSDQQEKYEALLSAMKESADLSNNISDNLISAADAIIEASQEFTDNLKFWSEFNRKYMENGKFKGGWAAQSELSTKDRFEISEDNLQADLKLIKDYDSEIKKLNDKLKNQSLSEADRAKYNQQLEEFKKGRAEAIEGYYDDIEELYSAWSDGWDLINSKLEDHISRLEKVNELYDGIMTLNKIVDKNYFGQDLLDKQVANSLAIAQTSYRQVQELQKQLNTKGLTEEQKAKIETELAEAAANAMTAYSNYFEKLKSAAQAELNNIFDQRGITEASERWERQKNYDDQYLNVADAQLNINKIQRNYKSAIENASSLAAQTQLRVKMEEELNKLQANRNKLTQYEVDRANAVYELTLKQIALEESQRNASKMKLTRDANGNLTYAFAQDQDAAAAAQAELEEAQNNLFNIDNDELRSRVDRYYQYQSEAQAALAQALADGDEERYNELREYYYGNNGLLTELQASLSGVQKNLEGSFKAIFPEGDIKSLSVFAEATKVSTVNLQNMAKEIEAVGNKFSTSIDSLQKFLGGDEGLIAKLDILVKQLQPNEEDENNLNSQIDDIKDYLQKIAKKLGAVENDINSATNKEYNGRSFFSSPDGVLHIDSNKAPETPKINSKLEEIAKSKDILSSSLGTVTDISVGPIDSDKILPYPNNWNKNYPNSDKIFSNINSNNSAKTTNNSITINNSFPNATDANGVLSAMEGMGGQINMFIDDTTK